MQTWCQLCLWSWLSPVGPNYLDILVCSSCPCRPKSPGPIISMTGLWFSVMVFDSYWFWSLVLGLVFGSRFWFFVLGFGFWFSVLVFGSWFGLLFSVLVLVLSFDFWFSVLIFGSQFWFLALGLVYIVVEFVLLVVHFVTIPPFTHLARFLLIANVCMAMMGKYWRSYIMSQNNN